jgi:phenylacetate-CoA ligase
MRGRARGTATVLRAWPGQRRAPFRSRARVHALRDANVRSIVRYAAETVPYYRELFRDLGLNPNMIETADDLDALPLLAKDPVQKAPERFRSASRLGRDAVAYRTAGSTGQPLDVYHDRPSLLRNIAYSERDRAVESRLCGKRLRYSAVHLDYRQATYLKVQRFYGKTSYRPFRPARHFVATEQPVGSIVEQVNALAPDIVRGNGGHLEAFFRAVVARNLQLRPPKIVLYYGDLMTPAARALIEERLGVPVLSRYGAMEAFKIGYVCEERRGFHLYEDLCHVKIVDADGEAVGYGELGEVVVSNLVNRGTVLLNYRLGDLARLLPAGCPCGRSSPMLADLEGRVTEILYLPDGEFVYPAPVWGLAKEVDGIVRLQLVQHESDRFELRLVTVTDAAYEQATAHMLPQLRQLLRGCRLEASRHDSLEPASGRKFRPIVAPPPPEPR